METFNVDNYVRRGKNIVLTLRPDQEDQGRQWGDTDIGLMLALIEQNIDEFHNQRRKKKDVWTDIANELNSQNYFWGPEDCRKKWSNMVRTFKHIIESQSEHKRMRWNFFETMLKIFTLPSARYLPESTAIMSVLSGIQVDPLEAIHHQEDEPPMRMRIVSTSSRNPDQYTANADSINNLSTSTETEEPINHVSLEESDHADEDEHVDTELENFITGDVIGSEYIHEAEDIEVSSQPMVVGALHNESEEHSQQNISESTEGSEEVFSVHLSTDQTAETAQSSITYSSSTRKRKLNNRQGRNEFQESLTEQFIAVTKEQNERVLALMTKFHEETINTMRDRNNILRDLSEALKHNPPS